jgi:hypothetical protein
MPFTVYIKRYQDAEPVAVTKSTTAGQALRKMGSVISGKALITDLEQCFAIGSRFGWVYSRDELAKLVRFGSPRPLRGTEAKYQPTDKPSIKTNRGAAA